MMKFIISTVMLFVCVITFGQTNPIDQKVINVFGQERFNSLSVNSPGTLQLLSKFAEFGVNVVPTNEKYNSFEGITEIPLRSKSGGSVTVQEFLADYHSGNFNALIYNFLPTREIQIFRLEGTNQVILIENQSTYLAK